MSLKAVTKMWWRPNIATVENIYKNDFTKKFKYIWNFWHALFAKLTENHRKNLQPAFLLSSDHMTITFNPNNAYFNCRIS